MTDKEILAAMKEMLAEERKLTDIKLEAMQKATDAKIEALQKETVQQIRVLLENGAEKQIKLLAEGHAQLLARLPEAEQQGKIKARVTTLEHVAAEHTRQICELRQA